MTVEYLWTCDTCGDEGRTDGNRVKKMPEGWVAIVAKVVTNEGQSKTTSRHYCPKHPRDEMPEIEPKPAPRPSPNPIRFRTSPVPYQGDRIPELPKRRT